MHTYSPPSSGMGDSCNFTPTECQLLRDLIHQPLVRTLTNNVNVFEKGVETNVTFTHAVSPNGDTISSATFDGSDITSNLNNSVVFNGVVDTISKTLAIEISNGSNPANLLSTAYAYAPQFSGRLPDGELEPTYTYLGLQDVDFTKHIQASNTITKQFVLNNEYAFLKNNTEVNAFQFNEVSFNLRYAYGEQTVTFMGVETPKVTRFPIVHLNVTNGWWQLANENIPYQRYTLGIEQRLPLHRLGHIEYSMEAGLQSGDVPLTKLFLSRGLGSGFKTYFIPNTFQTMQPNEFVSDQFVHLFLRWTIGTLTKKSVFFQPKVALIHNLAFGQLSTSLDNHLNVPLKTLEKGFFESGLEVNNLYRFSYLNIAYLGLGAGVYYRHGSYQLPTVEENLAYRLLISFSF